jgi:hypothetical protein
MGRMSCGAMKSTKVSPPRLRDAEKKGRISIPAKVSVSGFLCGENDRMEAGRFRAHSPCLRDEFTRSMGLER